MTWETCIRLAKNCRDNDDEEGALMYEEKANRKKNRDAAYYERQAKAYEANGNAEGALKWRTLAQEKKLVDSKPKPSKKAKEE